ncbi:MAG: hypothetical protein GX318_06330 [Clostridia bacterium]|nr:hypothetical protein [Clostridia bacterium]
MYSKGFLRKIKWGFISAAFLLGSLFSLMGVQEARAVEALDPVVISKEPITAGVVQKQYDWHKGSTKIYVLEVDLSNPYVKLDAIAGGGLLTHRLNVSAMARNTGAVAAVNGDFYNTAGEGAPIGPMIINQRLVSSPSLLNGLFALGIEDKGVKQERKAYIEAFSFEGEVTAPNGSKFSLAGLNKTTYYEDPSGTHSHQNKLHLYNDLWGGKTRGGDGATTPTEMLVKNGRVVEISQGSYLPYEKVPNGMEILRGHGNAASFLIENFKPGDSVKIFSTIRPDRNWSMIIGGHGLLVDQGKQVPYTRDTSGLGGNRARTAAGISKDGKRVYIVGVEGRTPTSQGLTLSDLSVFFEKIGAWRAFNLDGGGSTTMVARPLGEWDIQRVFPPEQENERLVVNALGVYSTAPKGTLDRLLIKTDKEYMFINERAHLSLAAHDQYYNPIDVKDLPVKWGTGDGGVVDGNTFTAKKPGEAKVTAKSGSTTASLLIKVLGKRDIIDFKLHADTDLFYEGTKASIELLLSAKDGKILKVPASSVEWQFYGCRGEVSPEGVLTIDMIGDMDAFVVARYDGFSAPLQVRLLEEVEADIPPMELTVGEREIMVDGSLEKMDVAPTVVHGRTLVPVRFVSQAMGSTTLWDDEAKNATIIRSKNWIDLWLGEKIMAVNGSVAALDVPPMIHQGRTMLPLSAVARMLNIQADWDAENKKVFLYQ